MLAPLNVSASDAITCGASAPSCPAIAAGRRTRAGSARRRPGRHPPVAMPRAARPTSTNGTGLSEWAVTGFPLASRSSSALPWSAVIARSAPGAAGSPASTARAAATIRARQPSMTSRRVDRRVPHAGVADHVRVGEVGDDEVVAARFDGLDEGVGDADRAHRGLEVVGRDAAGSGRAGAPRPDTAPRRRR